MPGKVKVRVVAGRNLPVMDRAKETTDAYVEIKLGQTVHKTEVCRRSLNPVWDSEWYKFEVEDAELQDEPLQIRLMDHDTYSANDLIGKAYLDLTPLLLPDGPALLSGWIPTFDTMHGLRGEVQIQVKLDLFSDSNKFRQSSCGVQFFCSEGVPEGYHLIEIHGFVEELIVNDDPEYQWIDKIRTPRASNEARQTLFFKLSGEVQRKIGLKVIEQGGNAVIGYLHNFDLEGESGVVARAIGTSVTISKTAPSPGSPLMQEHLERVEYPFLTISKLPKGVLARFGGTVTARSVKLLERTTHCPEEPETRDAWWTEIRMEVRSHARALACNAVLGYRETTAVCDDVCVLSASGTAALIGSSDDVFADSEEKAEEINVCAAWYVHVPYSESSLPRREPRGRLSRCGLCGGARVPDVLLVTVDSTPSETSLSQCGGLIHAFVARPKRDTKGELHAKEVSDALPFLEYDLHRMLVSKLQVRGMNMLLGLRVILAIGEKLMVALATGTAVQVAALPPPQPPKLAASSSSVDRTQLDLMQRKLLQTFVEMQQEDVTDLDLTYGSKDSCVLEMDDAEDVDLVNLLVDPKAPANLWVSSTEMVPGLSVKRLQPVRNLHMAAQVLRTKIPLGQPLSAYNDCVNQLLQSTYYKLRNTTPSWLSGVQMRVLLEQDEFQLSMVGMSIGVASTNNLDDPQKHVAPCSRYGIDITPLSFIAGGRIEKYLGNLNFFFIRESSYVREAGGLSSFVHTLLVEVLAIVRAHITALGGNALVAFFISDLSLYNYPHKNQAQCLINVGGDVVSVSYSPLATPS